MISERQAYLIENLVEFGRTDAERLNDIEDWFARIISTHKFPIAPCFFLGPGLNMSARLARGIAWGHRNALPGLDSSDNFGPSIVAFGGITWGSSGNRDPPDQGLVEVEGFGESRERFPCNIPASDFPIAFLVSPRSLYSPADESHRVGSDIIGPSNFLNRLTPSIQRLDFLITFLTTFLIALSQIFLSG